MLVCVQCRCNAIWGTYVPHVRQQASIWKQKSPPPLPNLWKSKSPDNVQCTAIFFHLWRTVMCFTWKKNDVCVASDGCCLRNPRSLKVHDAADYLSKCENRCLVLRPLWHHGHQRGDAGAFLHWIPLWALFSCTGHIVAY